jgi:hypothetical protein
MDLRSSRGTPANGVGGSATALLPPLLPVTGEFSLVRREDRQRVPQPVFGLGSYAPVTILIQELPGGGTQVAYDTVASAIAPYADAAASQVAQRLDTEVLSLLHHATGMPATATP